MASTWEIVSSAFGLLLFLAVVYISILIARSISSQETSTKSSLQSKGITYSNGRLKVQTDRAPLSREEYIASTQRAFEKGAKTFALHPDAFRTGPSQSSGDNGVNGEKKAFQRTKKLA
ncbi:hypothetical protein M231_00410 [Tremella mesenterica]|uniref:Uncharacterized protein n=1 Tax=Tremella mesenterica TaxID=5217 RepID=A0A4Q1BWA0_TREME|nr:hypothetical protein M231_00410 [Tremella mesenterica]